MGCASSKEVISATAVQVYRPPPSSVAIFDINSVEEPWLKNIDSAVTTKDDVKSSDTPQLPPPILAKITSFEDAAPRSWDEISKALEDLNKPTDQTAAAAAANTKNTQKPLETDDAAAQVNTIKKPRRKSFSFHTIEELDSKLKPAVEITNKKPKPVGQSPLQRAQSTGVDSTRPLAVANIDTATFKSVRENPFLLRDRQEKEKEAKTVARWDPLSGFPEMCPPGGANTVVLYTTSLRMVRKTFEDCNTARSILETHCVVFDERDVALHGKFLIELKELLGEAEGVPAVPKLFVKGRYLGGVEEVVHLNEMGRLGRIMSWAKVERGVGMQGCEGCGGARFVPCMECGGSCKVLVGDEKQRCPMCNENGLALCPMCH